MRYIFDELLDPVGVDASFYRDPATPRSTTTATTRQLEGRQAPRIDFFERAGSGKMTISVPDYIRFLNALENGLIIPKQLVEKMKGTRRTGSASTASGTAPPAPTTGRTAAVPPSRGRSAAARPLAMVFPGDTQVYIATNSDNNDYAGNLTSIAANAFDNALK